MARNNGKKYVVLVIDSSGDAEYNGVYEGFHTKSEATLWAKQNVPANIKWHAYPLLPSSEFKPEEWSEDHDNHVSKAN